MNRMTGRALSVAAAAMPFAFASIRAIRTTWDFRYFLMAFAGLVGAAATLAIGRGYAGGSNTFAMTLAAFVAAGLLTVVAAIAIGTRLGLGLLVISIHLLNVWMKPKFDTAAKNVEAAEIGLRNPEFIGVTLADLRSRLPAGVAIAAVRRDHKNQIPDDTMVLRSDDVVMATATAPDALAAAVKLIGELHQGRMVGHSADLGYLRVFASAGTVVGQSLGSLRYPDGIAVSIAHVRRGDADMMPHPDLILEVGDRVGLLASRSHTNALRKFFGDSIKGTAEVSYISVGLGMAIGFAVGAISIPIPGIGKMALGFIGVLLVALILGNLRRTGGINWTMPLSANKVLFNLGLTLFLANAGMSTGANVVATVAQNGVMILVLGAAVLIAIVLPVIVLGLFVFKMSYDEMAGVLAGATGNPAILAYANKLAPTDRPDIGYAMIFPSMTILKILFVNVAAALM